MTVPARPATSTLFPLTDPVRSLALPSRPALSALRPFAVPLASTTGPRRARPVRLPAHDARDTVTALQVTASPLHKRVLPYVVDLLSRCGDAFLPSHQVIGCAPSLHGLSSRAQTLPPAPTFRALRD